MRRVADFVVRNWPLKLGAILLATVLYSGLVLGQNVRTWTGTLPVDAIRQPADTAMLSDLDPITQVRYRAPLDIGVVSPASFSASVDLSRVTVQPGGATQSVPVSVVALDGRVQIVDFQPRELQVQLDPVAEKLMPVTVTVGTVPDGVSHAPPQAEPSTVTIRGAKSRVDFVAAVVARVAIDASALNVDRDIELVAVDSNSNTVPNVEIDPERARVRIAVARELANRTLPVVPQIVGQPQPGYRISSVSVEPLVVTVSGEESVVTRLETAATEPIDISGRSTDLEAVVRVDLPDGVGVSGNDTIRVLVTIAEETGTRTYNVGVVMEGGQSDQQYVISTTSASVTLGGPISALDAVDGSGLVVTADISVASTDDTYTLQITPPPGLEVVAISPTEVLIQRLALVTPPATPAPQ